MLVVFFKCDDRFDKHNKKLRNLNQYSGTFVHIECTANVPASSSHTQACVGGFMCCLIYFGCFCDACGETTHQATPKIAEQNFVIRILCVLCLEVRKRNALKTSDFEMTVNFQRVTTHIFQFLGLASQCFSLLSFFLVAFLFIRLFEINIKLYFSTSLRFSLFLSVRTSFVYVHMIVVFVLFKVYYKCCLLIPKRNL
jgi:hypothetical protein